MNDIVILLETGWSWHQLQSTPEWVVRDLKTLLQKRALVARERRRAQEALGG
jgi:hypothetical protein